MPEAPRHAYMVSHTHWDREWYLTYAKFRVQLIEVVDAVLDRLESDPEFRHFCLDGQTLVVRDYLEARPDQADRIRRLVEAGSLTLGPWYVLPDAFLVSGEATVRNLQLGHADAAHYGGAQKVGYLPDTFGHLAQTPQILRQAGIDSFVYWRGHGDEDHKLGLEWWWEAPDGSRVLAINQEDGYVNAAALGHTELWHAHTPREVDPARAVAKVGNLFTKMAARSHTSTWLLGNGCDHHPPQRALGAMLTALREAFPDTTFTHGSFADFVAAVARDLPDDLPVWRGELLGGKNALILSGVWSARMPLKQQNAACQDLLAHQLEPLLAYAHFIHGRPHNHDLVDHCWRELLKNHPHDSICGCSVDQVHRTMNTRFAEVRDTGKHLISRTLESLVPAFAPCDDDDRDTLIVVANPLPWRRTEVIDRLVVLQPLGYDHDRFRLIGPDGRAVPCVIKSRRFLQRFWGVDYRSELDATTQRDRLDTYIDAFADRIVKTEADRDTDLVDAFLDIQFLARDLPPCGHAVYRLTDGADDTEPADLRLVDLVRADGPVLENESVRVTVHPDGSLDLVDKRSGREFRGLNLLESTEDAGDEYDWSPCPESRTVATADIVGKLELVEDTGLAATLRVGFEWTLPRSLTRDRRRRTPEVVACQVRIDVRLCALSNVVAVTVDIDNQARDHRIRAVFPTGVSTDRVVSDGQFLLVARPITPPSGEDWMQPHPGTYPQQDFSLVSDVGGNGLAVIADGLPEIATRRGADGSAVLSLTLLRGVGWLSRDDFPTRRNTNAGPTIPTPEAQCLGRQVFRYGLAPLTAGAAGLRRLAREILRPSPTRQGVAADASPGGFLLETTNHDVTVSALRRHPERNTLVVRLWNETARPQTERLRFGRPVTAVWLLDLLESRQEEQQRPTTPANEVVVNLLPHRIVTVEVVFDERDQPREQ